MELPIKRVDNAVSTEFWLEGSNQADTCQKESGA